MWACFMILYLMKVEIRTVKEGTGTGMLGWHFNLHPCQILFFLNMRRGKHLLRPGWVVLKES